jgi:AraC-like DNA-binding protein
VNSAKFGQGLNLPEWNAYYPRELLNQMIMPPYTHKQFTLLPLGTQPDESSLPTDCLIFSRHEESSHPTNSSWTGPVLHLPIQEPPPKSKALLVVFDPSEGNFYELLVGFLTQQRCYEVNAQPVGTESADETPAPTARGTTLKETASRSLPVSDFLAPENAFLVKINQLIERHLEDEELRSSLLAKACFMCEMQLHRKLKKLAKLSTANYIRKFRLWKGRSMLENPTLTITEVCYKVGFKSLEYFSRSFKEEFGVCPKYYRIQH